MDYALLKLLHQTTVVLSFSGFVLRGLAALAGAAWVRGRLARTLPHAVDTLLLLSALAMAWMLRLTPGNAPWLVAKIGGLLLYIALGMLALRPGRALALRATAWAAALLVFGWIVSVAVTKDPLGLLRPLATQASSPL
jgi:uncharacterized membrane protein SirB2